MQAEKSTRRKTPFEKKQDVYDKDHRGNKENPHRFRKGKPRKKKGVNRQERSRTRNLIRNAMLHAAEENLSVPLLKTMAEPIRSFPWKGASTVRDIVARKIECRARRQQFSLWKKKKSAASGNPKNPLPGDV